MRRLNRFRTIPVVLSLAALALSAAVASCIKQKDSLVIVDMTSAVNVAGPIDVHVTVGNVTQVFSLANGLSTTTATERGVYIDSDETGNIAVSATTQAGTSPCIVYSSPPGQTVNVPSAGSTVTTSLTLASTGTCGGNADGGVGGSGGAVGTGGASGSGGAVGTGGTPGTGGAVGTGGAPGTGGKGGAAGTGAGGSGMGGAGVGGAGGAVVVAPPSLSRCFEIHHTDIACDMTSGAGDNSVFSVAFSPDGKLLLSAGDDGRIRFWNVQAGPTAPTVDGRELTTSGQGYLAFSHNGQYLAAGDGSGNVTVWTMSNAPSVYFTFNVAATASVDSVWFSPDDTHLISVSNDTTTLVNQLTVWSMSARTSVATVSLTAVPWWVRVSPLATATALPLVVTQEDGNFVLMDALASSVTKITKMVSNNFDDLHVFAEGVSYSPDGKSLLLGSQDGSLSLWTGVPTNPVRTTPDYIPADTAGKNKATKAVAFFPDGAHVVSASGTAFNGGQLTIFATTTKQQLGTKVPTWYFLSLDVSPDGGGVAAGEVDCGLVMYCHD